jgi:hypothetical protein
MIDRVFYTVIAMHSKLAALGAIFLILRVSQSTNFRRQEQGPQRDLQDGMDALGLFGDDVSMFLSATASVRQDCERPRVRRWFNSTYVSYRAERKTLQSRVCYAVCMNKNLIDRLLPIN